MTMTYFFAGKVIDHNLRNQAYTVPTTIYLALFTTAPTKAGGGTEVSGVSYARQSCALDAASVNANGTTQNTSDITFPTAGGSWGTITHCAIFDAVTTGNMLLYQALNASRGPVVLNDIVKFLDSELDFTFD